MFRHNTAEQHLGISVFYNKKSWPDLIIEGIDPFIKSVEKIDKFYIELNGTMGFHILLVLITNRKYARDIAEKVDVYFKKFLREYPSSNQELLPSYAIFQNFKNNTIQYNVCEIVLANRRYLLYKHQLSIVLIKIFVYYGKNTLDDLLEIMIQLFTIFCNTIKVTNQQAIKLFSDLLELEEKKCDSEIVKKIAGLNIDNFEKNKSQIVEYLKKHRKVDRILYNESWENTWSITIQEYIKSFTNNINPVQNIDAEYTFIIQELVDTFDFNDRMSAYYLFSEGLKLVS